MMDKEWIQVEDKQVNLQPGIECHRGNENRTTQNY